ncbi:MAG: PEP/pyruvate-binding domain-containing protein, partial [Candidatus Sumerlaeota bacterium]
MSKQWVYYTRDSLPQGIEDPKSILGGKGASLQAMSAAGLPVPPAFVISTEACEYFFEHDETWPEGLQEQIDANLERLESDMERTYGEGDQPLLVSVRSGAARSMPGMMDTLLNVGLHPALADRVGDTPEFWDLFGQFVVMYAKTVADFTPEDFKDLQSDKMSRDNLEAMIARFESKTGE